MQDLIKPTNLSSLVNIHIVLSSYLSREAMVQRGQFTKSHYVFAIQHTIEWLKKLEIHIFIKLQYEGARWQRVVEIMVITHFLFRRHLSFNNKFITTRKRTRTCEHGLIDEGVNPVKWGAMSYFKFFIFFPFDSCSIKRSK